MIEFHSLDVEFLTENQPELAVWLSKSAMAESCSIGAINLVLCSDEHLLGMNQQFLDHDFYTDIITFDTSDGRVLSGDLYVSIDRVRDNASTLKVNFVDELHRVFVHGLLHLCGFGDKSDAEQSIMRSKEDHYLSLRAFV